MITVMTDEKVLRIPCEIATQAEAEEIWPKLIDSLIGRDGWGMAAPQIGIRKQVAIITYAGKIIKLLNPKILELTDPVVFKGEGCFSMPNYHMDTIRFTNVVFENEVDGERRKYYVTRADGHLAAILQHEIDHLNGKLMIDHKQVPFKANSPKIGRNEPCVCGSGKKYKKCCLGRAYE